MLEMFQRLAHGGGGFWLFVHFVLAVWAVYSIFQNQTSGGLAKALWACLVFFFPGGGLILWFLFGPKAPKKLG